jgi:hypothetical protein
MSEFLPYSPAATFSSHNSFKRRTYIKEPMFSSPHRNTSKWLQNTNAGSNCHQSSAHKNQSQSEPIFFSLPRSRRPSFSEDLWIFLCVPCASRIQGQGVSIQGLGFEDPVYGHFAGGDCCCTRHAEVLPMHSISPGENWWQTVLK